MRCANEEIFDGLKCSLSVFSDYLFAVILCCTVYHNLRMSTTYCIWSHHNTCCLFAPLFALMDLSVNSNSNHDPSQYDHSCRREMFYFSYIHKGQNILNANISRNVGWIKCSIMPRCNSSICICLHTWVCFRPRYLSWHYTLCWNVNNAMKLKQKPLFWALHHPSISCALMHFYIGQLHYQSV